MNKQRFNITRRTILGAAMALPLAVSTSLGLVSPVAAQSTDTVKIAIPLAFRGLDPHEGLVARAELSLQSHIYPSLTRINKDLEVVGDLATSWDRVDATTWEFEIHPAVRFENGTLLDADEIIANFKRMLDPDSGFTFASDIRSVIESIEAVSPTRVRFNLTTPYPDFLRRLSYIFFIDTEWAKTHNPKLEANGTGPYKLVSFDPENSAVLELNPNYYGETPDFANVELKVLQSPAQRLTGLLSGEIDAAAILDPQDLQQLEDNGNFTVGAVDSSRSMYAWFNTTKAPLDNKLVRQALNYAVNKEVIVDTLLRGYGSVLKGQVFSEGYNGYNPDLDPYPYDPEKAKALLAEAGFPNGFTTTMSVPTGAYVAGDQIAQVVAAQLAQVGVNVEMALAPMQTLIQQQNDADLVAPLRFIGYAAYDMSARGFLIYFRSEGASNHAKDPGFDELYYRYLAAPTDAEQAELVTEITEHMRDYAPMLFLYSQPTTYAVRKDIDWVARPDDWLLAFDMERID